MKRLLPLLAFLLIGCKPAPQFWPMSSAAWLKYQDVPQMCEYVDTGDLNGTVTTFTQRCDYQDLLETELRPNLLWERHYLSERNT